MSDFSVKVWLIEEPVINHPNADRLTIVKIGGYECIANKNPDGSFRYNEGDAVIYIPEGAVVPEWILKQLDMWNAEENKGMLAGPLGNRVKAIKLRGIVSQGILYPTTGGFDEPLSDELGATPYIGVEVDNDGEMEEIYLEFDTDYAESFGITKYEPPVPTSMSGEVFALYGHPIKYDFENIKAVPGIFHDRDMVVATEKLHGTFCQIGIIPNFRHDELFGRNKNIYVCSKGLGAQGLVFKNNAANKNNLYVKTLLRLIDNGLDDILGETMWAYRIFGEIYGQGVQDLHYDCAKPAFAVFDIMCQDTFLNWETFKSTAAGLNLATVPVLYHDWFDKEKLETLRDGKTMLGGKNIREGLVIKEATEATKHPTYGRKIAKMVSPDYLLRKGNVTEYT